MMDAVLCVVVEGGASKQTQALKLKGRVDGLFVCLPRLVLEWMILDDVNGCIVTQ